MTEQFAKLVTVLFVCLGLSLVFGIRRVEATRANVLIILTDDLGYGEVNQHAPAWGFPLDALSPGGGSPIQRPNNPARTMRTPNLERLARDGMRLTMSYAPSSVCGPSRASILGERHVGVTPIRGNFEIRDTEFVEEFPLASDLKQFRGYKTAYMGKWGLGQVTGGPWSHGFDYFVGHLTHREAHYYFPNYLTRYNSSVHARPQTLAQSLALRVPVEGNVGKAFTESTCPLDPQSTCTYSNDIFRDEVLRFISNGANWPFFVMWAPTYPHSGRYIANTNGPYSSPVKRITPGRMKDGLPEFARGHASQIEMHLDGDIGALLDLMATNRTLDRHTFIVFSSDNGPHKDSKDYTIETFQSSGGLRGYKRSMHDGGIRVPTIVRFPRAFPRGVVSNIPTALYDLGATIREIAGIPGKRMSIPAGLHPGAVSMFRAWSSNNVTMAPKRDWLYFELCPSKHFQDFECSNAILDIRNFHIPNSPLYKIVVLNRRRTKLLFDLRSDPMEKSPIRNNQIFEEIWSWRSRIRFAAYTSRPPRRSG